MTVSSLLFEDTHYGEKSVGFSSRILHSWQDMRSATRDLIEQRPDEGRLLFFVLMSDMVFFLSRTLKPIVAPTGAAVERIPLEIGLWLIFALMIRTATIYLASGLLWGFARAFGGKGSWKETRVGVFWGAFVSAPFGLLAAVITVTLALNEDRFPILGNDAFTLPPYWLGLIPFVWFISVGLAEANKIKRTAPIFMALSVLSVVLVIGAMYLRANAII